MQVRGTTEASSSAEDISSTDRLPAPSAEDPGGENTPLRRWQKFSEWCLTLSGDPQTVFERAVRMIGELFEVRVVCLSQPAGHELLFKAVYVDGRIRTDAGRCPLDVTPCATVAESLEIRSYDQVQERFPKAAFLREHRARAYCGFPSLGREGEVLAVTCLLDDRPRRFSEEDQHLLRMMGQRLAAEVERGAIGAELAKAERELAERSQMQAELAASEARLRAIFDTEPECVKLLAADGSLLEMNPAGLWMLEADSFEQVAGQCVYPLVAAEHRDAFREFTEKVFRGVSGKLEFQITGLKGTRRWLETHASPLRDASGKITALLGITRDITGRKRAESVAEAMLALATRLSTVATPWEASRAIFGVADQLWAWDSGTLDVYSSAEDRVWAVMYFDVVDGKRREVLPDRPTEQPTPRMRRVMRDGAELLLRSPPCTQGTDSRTFGDTARLSASIMCVPIHTQGQPVGVLSIQSYTANAFTEADLKLLQGLANHCGGTLERLQAAEARRESERVLKTLISNLPGMAYRCLNDPDWTMTFVSDGCLALTGYARSELEHNRGVAHGNLVHPDDRDWLRKKCRSSLEARQPCNNEYRILTKTGETRWVWERATGIYAPDGTLSTIEGFVQDISERLRAERRIAALATLGRRLNEAEDGVAAARIIVGIADELFGWDSCKLDLYDAATDRCRSLLTMDILAGRRQEVAPAYASEPPSPRMRRVIQNEPMLILRENPAAEVSDFTPFGDKSRPSASMMFVPLREGGAVIGALSIQSYRPHAYTPADLAALQDLADHCAGAMERLHGRDALRESEAKYRGLVERMGEGLLVVDNADVIQFANRRLSEMLGFGLEEMLGRNASDLLLRAEDCAAMRRRTVDREHGLSGSYEVQLRRRSGELIWCLNSGTPIRSRDGMITGAMAIITDITERRRMESALRASEAKFRTIIESSPVAMSMDDASLNITFLNRKFVETFGYTRADIPTLAEWWQRAYPYPPYRRHVIQAWEAAVARARRDGIEVEPMEFKVTAQDGTVRDIRFNLAAMSDENLVILYDLTESKQSETALRELSGRLLRLQDEERRRIARELHDTTAQNLSALAMNLSVLAGVVATGDERGRQLLGDCEHLVERSVCELRTFSYLLHPPSLEQLGLVRAMRDYAEGFAQRSGVRVELDLAEALGRLSDDDELALFRVLQESLGNVHRHSGSPTAGIRLAVAGGEIRLEVRDAGRGLDAGACDGSRLGVGIAGMRERLRQLGGRLEIEPQSPGTLVRAILPLEKREA